METESRRSKRTIVAVAVAIVAIAVVAAYAVIDPSSGYLPRCPVKTLTGFDCPGCGSQRMFHSLLHGDLRSAWSYNPFVFLMVPVVVAAIVGEVWSRKFPRLHRAMSSPAVIVGVIVATALWTLWRNL